MFATYDGTHSITFGKLATLSVSDVNETNHVVSYVRGKNTWSSWHLIPSSRPVVNPPAPVYKLIDIPGINGTLDLSRALTGRMKYQNRTGSWEFILDHEQSKHWETAFSEIADYLHGESLCCVLKDDPEYYYEGNFSVSSPKADKNWSSLVIDYNLYPFKRFIQRSDELWLWNPFNFETGYAHNYDNVSVPANSHVDLAVRVYDEPIKPEVYSSTSGSTSNGTTKIVYKSKTTVLSSGWHQYPGLILERGSGNETATVRLQNDTGSTVTMGIRFRGGKL